MKNWKNWDRARTLQINIDCGHDDCCRCGSIDSIYGAVRNPWKYDFTGTNNSSSLTSSSVRQQHATNEAYNEWYIAGGSSGGSAVAVATGMAFA